jgi:pantothenate kinase
MLFFAHEIKRRKPLTIQVFSHRRMQCWTLFLLLMLSTTSVVSFSKNSPTPNKKIESQLNRMPRKELEASNVWDLVTRSLDVFENSANSQVFIAIAGAPGSGKSTLALRLVNSINELMKDASFSIVVPMDGYHLSQSQLRALGESGLLFGDNDASLGEATTYDDLMKRRGAPWTFDPKRLHQDLSILKATGSGSFPLHDRTISDPIPDQIHITRNHKIIVCEGNYILAFDDPAWNPLQYIWDDTWLLDVPEAVLKERLIRRHLLNWNASKEARFGKGRDGAIAKVVSSDLKNAKFVYRNSQSNANIIVRNA